MNTHSKNAYASGQRSVIAGNTTRADTPATPAAPPPFELKREETSADRRYYGNKPTPGAPKAVPGRRQRPGTFSVETAADVNRTLAEAFRYLSDAAVESVEIAVATDDLMRRTRAALDLAAARGDVTPDRARDVRLRRFDLPSPAEAAPAVETPVLLPEGTPALTAATPAEVSPPAVPEPEPEPGTGLLLDPPTAGDPVLTGDDADPDDDADADDGDTP